METESRLDVGILPEDERRILEPVIEVPGITQVVAFSDFSDAKVSQTLTVLRDRGLVDREPRGRTYRLYPGRVLDDPAIDPRAGDRAILSNISSTISVRTANNHVNRHNRTGGRGDRNGPGRRREWGKIGLAVLVSVFASLVVHYFTVAAIDLHPTVHALVGIVLFFVAGFILFKIVLF